MRVVQDVSTPAAVRLAAVVLGLQGIALLAAAGVLVAKTVGGHPDSVGRALSGAGLALGGAAVLIVGARGLLRLRSTARTPVVVLEAIALPVGYDLAFQAGRVGYGGPILVSALVVLYLLFTPPAREALDREFS